ncbi:MAG: diguanylate cyclase [Gemmatimonadetes bacterium]|nr:diguanylate cyclase [Gemmatimonadota bacterium]MBI2614085.1 diguanylate cyclase [Gemmatimonadota bacterium]
MQAWEVTVSSVLRALGAEGIKRRFLMFAALATLIPSVSTAVLSYVQNRRALTQRIAEALRAASSQGAREVDLWMKERLYDVRVFASSYEVSENLDRARPGRAGVAVRRLGDYLSSVKERFVDYQALIVVDRNAVAVASSAAGSARAVELPADWVAQARSRDAIVGQVYWDSTAGRPLMTLGVPVSTSDGRFLGALAAKLDLTPVAASLASFAAEPSGMLYLVTGAGELVVSSAGADRALMSRRIGGRTLERLTREGRGPVEYGNHEARDVLGALAPIRRLDWAVVAEIPADEAYAQIARLRTLTLVTVLLLLVVIGGLAYLLGLTVVLPLGRLARGARQVAGGDLTVALPVVGGGEAAYVTEVFNHMVTRLKQGREELERLSRTDGLTGLPNRRHLMETLEKEARRAQRNARPFALLMIDVDHFKRYNDAFGHLAGDDVLKRVADALQGTVRTADYAARYGGEEFIALLPETPLDSALEVAERIRTRMAEEEFGTNGSRVTLSIGLGEFPTDGATPEAVIAAADGALYRAKEHGRNCVVTTRTLLTPVQVEGTPLEPPSAPPTVSPKTGAGPTAPDVKPPAQATGRKRKPQ